MAPTKKTKKAAEGINSRLALVMKSGKGMYLRLDGFSSHKPGKHQV